MNREEVIDLIKDAGFGYLATIEGDQPRVRPMMPHMTDDGQLLLALLGRSRSIDQIKKNPKVEFCFVDRKMWYCRVAGLAKISDDLSKKETIWNAIPMLRQYFSGPEDPNFVLAEINIAEDAEAMTPHQKSPDRISLA